MASSAPAVRAIRSGQAAWTARGRRLRALLSDEQAGVAELKRELSNLLLAAEASLAEAAEERKLLAAEMQGLLPPLLKEIAVMKKIRHPNCVMLYEVIDNPQSDEVRAALLAAPDAAAAHAVLADHDS